MKETHRLKTGESFTYNGVQVSVAKCGLHSEGDQSAEPTVTIEVDAAELHQSHAAELPTKLHTRKKH